MELSISKGCEPVNKLWICPLHEDGSLPPSLNFQKLFDTFDAEYEVLCNEGSVFYIKTNCGAQKYKVIKLDLAQPDKVELLLPISIQSLKFGRACPNCTLLH